MKQAKKRLISGKIFAGIFILAIFCTNVFSIIYHNGSGGGYGSAGESSAVRSSLIDAYVVEGAGYFLDGYKDVIAILSSSETAESQGIDFDELLGTVENALTNLDKTKAAYQKLIAEAEITPYNEAVTARLVSFDYDSFMDGSGLIPAVFKDVEKFLKKGDITGALKKSSAQFANLTGLLNSIKEEVSQGRMPAIASLWKLNQEYGAELLFGQYTAQVYDALNK